MDMGTSRALDRIIPRVVKLLRESQHLADDEIRKELVRQGIDPDMALRLVEFLPMAYARLVFQRSGARFSDRFKRVGRDGTLREYVLADEPVWKPALGFAQHEIARGTPGSELVAVAARSAEFQAANELLNKGSKLKDIVFTPTVLTREDNGLGPK